MIGSGFTGSGVGFALGVTEGVLFTPGVTEGVFFTAGVTEGVFFGFFPVFVPELPCSFPSPDGESSPFPSPVCFSSGPVTFSVMTVTGSFSPSPFCETGVTGYIPCVFIVEERICVDGFAEG